MLIGHGAGSSTYYLKHTKKFFVLEAGYKKVVNGLSEMLGYSIWLNINETMLI